VRRHSRTGTRSGREDPQGSGGPESDERTCRARQHRPFVDPGHLGLDTLRDHHRPDHVTCGSPSPFAWRRRARLEELLASSFDLQIEEGTNRFRYASGEQAWNLWVNHYGPATSLDANLDDGERAEFRKAMIAWHETFGSELGYDQPREYLITHAVRR
jgi:hypothetical protein